MAFPPLLRRSMMIRRSLWLLFDYEPKPGDGAMAHGVQYFFLCEFHQIPFLLVAVKFDRCILDVFRY